MHNNRTGRVSVAIVMGIVAAAVLLAVVYWKFPFAGGAAAETRARLVHQTDHQALLEACRKVMQESGSGKWEQGRSYSFRPDPDSKASGFPEAIRALNPSSIVIYDANFLFIEVMGGVPYHGVRAYSKDFEDPGYRGDKKLIEGLWYYDDGYGIEENFEKTIESLKPKE